MHFCVQAWDVFYVCLLFSTFEHLVLKDLTKHQFYFFHREKNNRKSNRKWKSIMLFYKVWICYAFPKWFALKFISAIRSLSKTTKRNLKWSKDALKIYHAHLFAFLVWWFYTHKVHNLIVATNSLLILPLAHSMSAIARM